MRYLVASLLTADSETQIRHSFEATYHTPCTVKTLHLTFLPPFTTQVENLSTITQALQQIPPIPSLTFSHQAIFEHKRRILHLPLESKQTLTAIYQQLFSELRPLLTFNTTDFATDTIPEFIPHLTLSYNFESEIIPLIDPPQTLIFDPTSLLQENGPGLWQPIT